MTQKIISFIFIYIMTFWIVIFIVLPFGVKTEDNPISGNDHGAPKNSMIKKKIIITAIISFVLVTVYFILKENDLIDISLLVE